MKILLIRVLAVIFLVVCCFLLRQYLAKRNIEAEQAEGVDANSVITAGGNIGQGREYDKPVDYDHPALLWFGKTYGNRAAIMGFAGDMTDDGLDDLIILYHEDGIIDICWMCVAVQSVDGSWSATEPVRAPVENQKIRVFDMDKEPPMEFVITGEKKGEIGYAIFRVIEGALIDLFGEGMNDCC